MSTSFPRTVRALQTDGMTPTILGLILITAVMACWGCWLVLGRVAVYELSLTARLEAERVHPVDAIVGGRIVASHLSLARDVRRGDVLLEIEADRELLETTEERRRLAAISTQLETFRTEIPAEEEAITLTGRAARVTLSQAAEHLAAAEAAARQAGDQYARLRQLSEHGLVADADLARARTEVEARQADVAAARLGVERVDAEQIAAERERRAHLGELLRERVLLEGQKAAAMAAVMRSEHEEDDRRIRATADGRLGEIAPLQVGAVIREGERLASIVSAGPVKAVAEFPPSALGRVRAGQHARLRLDGFPWTQYGYIPATVHSVASETRESRVRVELALQPSPSSAIPLEHGLPGTIEVEIERVAPVSLLVRTLGYALVTADAQVEPHDHERAGQ